MASYDAQDSDDARLSSDTSKVSLASVIPLGEYLEDTMPDSDRDDIIPESDRDGNDFPLYSSLSFRSLNGDLGSGGGGGGGVVVERGGGGTNRLYS